MIDTFNIMLDNDKSGEPNIGIEFEFYSNDNLHVMVYEDQKSAKLCIGEIFLEPDQYKRLLKFIIDNI